MKVAEAFRLL